jgi:hypothetical protein
VAVGGALVLDERSGGWFRYYCFYLPVGHPRTGAGLLTFWTKDLLSTLPIDTLAASMYTVGRFRSDEGRRALFFPLLAAGMIGSSWAVRNMVGAEVNDLMPSFAAVSMLGALSLHQFLGRAARAGSGRWAPVAVLALVLFAAQLAMLGYNPRKYLPTAADREAGTKLVDRIARIRGDVFVPHHGYLAVLAGKTAATALSPIIGEFMNELVDQQIRIKLEAEFGQVRSLIVAEAFAAGRTLESGSDDDDYIRDPHGAGVRR